MKKTVVHIISHSHWDREWYLPFEAHRMQLVQLFDDLFELFQTDSDFKSFHLDGQTIVLDDYLAIRPEKAEQLRHYIQTGKLKIGPFYILQDDFLISSEANVRNTLIGHNESKKWGEPVKIGYFPDTFGNMGQAPQLLKKADLDVACFGRGVKPIGFDNKVLDDKQFTSKFSEMYWQSPDGSKVLGVLFANWYSNGNEIPVDKKEARLYWDQKLADARQYAATNQLLMMNGCDHQPVQKNISEAIRVANDLYDDVLFVHSNFEDYIKALKLELPNDLSTVTGELTSQETDGWYTLANTASSRIYLKQANVKASNLLEQVVEPLAIMSGQTYPKDQLNYAWKLLLQNAPHDSICGCSVDEVHQEMQTRFAKVQQVGQSLASELLTNWTNQFATETLKQPSFVVVNTSFFDKTDLATVEIELKTADFKTLTPSQAYEAMQNSVLPNYCVKTEQGEICQAKIEDLGAVFSYDLPKDAFRHAYIARKLRISLPVSLKALSWQTFYLAEAVPVKQENPLYVDGKVNTPLLTLHINQTNGTLTLKDKQTGYIFTDLLQFEDCGDIGNEYIFKQPNDTKPIHAMFKNMRIIENNSMFCCLMLTHELIIPVAADEQLLLEQKALVEFRDRQAKRSNRMENLVIETEIKIYKDSKQIQFKSSFNNQMKDHRVRVLFPTQLQTTTHEAESIFEVFKRDNIVASTWENPENPQHQQAFVSLSDQQKGLVVANIGLQEYEILKDNTIALTLLRCVGELGDWGYFPTPQAQCLGEHHVEYALELFTQKDKYAAFKRAKGFQVDYLTKQLTQHKGLVPLTAQFSQHPVFTYDALCATALKQIEDSEQTIIRYYNMSNCAIDVYETEQPYVSLLEEIKGTQSKTVAAHEIRTEKFK